MDLEEKVAYVQNKTGLPRDKVLDMIPYLSERYFAEKSFYTKEMIIEAVNVGKSINDILVKYNNRPSDNKPVNSPQIEAFLKMEEKRRQIGMEDFHRFHEDAVRKANGSSIHLKTKEDIELEKLLKNGGWGPGPYYEHNQEVFAAEAKARKTRDKLDELKFKDSDFEQMASEQASNIRGLAERQFSRGDISHEDFQRRMAEAKHIEFVNSRAWYDQSNQSASENITHMADANFASGEISFEEYQRQLAKAKVMKQ